MTPHFGGKFKLYLIAGSESVAGEEGDDPLGQALRRQRHVLLRRRQARGGHTFTSASHSSSRFWLKYH